MKKLVLMVWVLMQILVPTMATAELYATAVQLELAFFAVGVWYFNQCYSKVGLNVILRTFAIYYGYIYLTDQFITDMPQYMVFIESSIIFLILWLHLKHEK